MARRYCYVCGRDQEVNEDDDTLSCGHDAVDTVTKKAKTPETQEDYEHRMLEHP